MVSGMLFRDLQRYRLCKFAIATTALDVVLPGIATEKYFDGRLADTPDTIYYGGFGNLESLLTQKRFGDGKR